MSYPQNKLFLLTNVDKVTNRYVENGG